MSANNDSFVKTISVALVLCLVCSLLVSGAAILLKKDQQANKAADVRRSILLSSGLIKDGEKVDLNAIFEKNVVTKVIDMSTGDFVEGIDVNKFDQKAQAKNPNNNVVLSRQEDIASIKKRSKQAKVYLVKKEGKLTSLVLPIRGYGLFSTLHGFIALKADTSTVQGIIYYEHGETPGLGAEVENPVWRSAWVGKKALDSNFKPVIKLVKTGAKNDNEVDALSGATMTSTGVENMLTYWLSDEGFGPFLAKVRGGQHGV